MYEMHTRVEVRIQNKEDWQREAHKHTGSLVFQSSLTYYQGASIHTMTIRGVQFEVSANPIVQLLGLPHVSKASITKPIEAEKAHDMGTSASSTSLTDSMTHVEGDRFDIDD